MKSIFGEPIKLVLVAAAYTRIGGVVSFRTALTLEVKK